MTDHVTTSTEPAADPLDTIYFSVTAIEHAAKQVIRKALPADRIPMWTAFLSGMESAAEVSAERMPWEEVEVVTRLSARAARDALTVMLKAAAHGDQQRLAQVTAKECEKAENQAIREASDSVLGLGRYPHAYCAKCGRQFRPKRPGGKWCSDACRAHAYRQRRDARKDHVKDASLRDQQPAGLSMRLPGGQ